MNQACVMVTVVSVKGSAPRAVGSRMILTINAQRGSIGGGNLEFEATRTARELLERAKGPGQKQVPYGLGPALNQCCGGAVTLLFESLLSPDIDWLNTLQGLESPTFTRACPVLVTAIDQERVSKWVLVPGEPRPGGLPESVFSRIQTLSAQQDDAQFLVDAEEGRYLAERIERHAVHLALFGAGHVAKSVVEALSPLPFKLRWIDSRADQFPAEAHMHTSVIVSTDPAKEVRHCPPGNLYLVMTHSHELDEDICYEVLARDDAAWLGLIGSRTKRRRFAHRLAKRGLSEDQLKSLVCPVGLAGITGKRPATIAIAIAAQLLQEHVPENWR